MSWSRSLRADNRMMLARQEDPAEALQAYQNALNPRRVDVTAFRHISAEAHGFFALITCPDYLSADG